MEHSDIPALFVGIYPMADSPALRPVHRSWILRSFTRRRIAKMESLCEGGSNLWHFIQRMLSSLCKSFPLF